MPAPYASHPPGGSRITEAVPAPCPGVEKVAGLAGLTPTAPAPVILGPQPHPTPPVVGEVGPIRSAPPDHLGELVLVVVAEGAPAPVAGQVPVVVVGAGAVGGADQLVLHVHGEGVDHPGVGSLAEVPRRVVAILKILRRLTAGADRRPQLADVVIGLTPRAAGLLQGQTRAQSGHAGMIRVGHRVTGPGTVLGQEVSRRVG
jgi:hypothetical protein